MDFITDKPRENLLAQVARRINLKRSTMLYGEFGVGKSRLLTEIQKKHGGKIINCCSNTTQILGEMAGVSEPVTWHKQRYINTIKKQQGIYLLDEGQESPAQLFMQFKAFVDAGCIFVIASKAHKADGEITNELEEKLLLTNHRDVLERFIRLKIDDLHLEPMEDYLLKNRFNEEAAGDIYSLLTSTRTRIDVIEEAILYAQENKIPTITSEIIKNLL